MTSAIYCTHYRSEAGQHSEVTRGHDVTTLNFRSTAGQRPVVKRCHDVTTLLYSIA